MSQESKFLYLTTIGRSSGKPREIEIWYTQYRQNYYVISYLFRRCQWVQNIQKNPGVHFRVGQKAYSGRARIPDPLREPELYDVIKRLSEKKYGWSDGRKWR